MKNGTESTGLRIKEGASIKQLEEKETDVSVRKTKRITNKNIPFRICVNPLDNLYPSVVPYNPENI
jgi:hypothetical protein